MIRCKKIPALLAAAGLLALALPHTAAAGEMEDLKNLVQQLRAEVDALKAHQTAAPANVVTGGAMPGSFKLPGSDTSVKLGGYVQLDAIYDLRGNQGAGIYADEVPLAGSADDKRRNVSTLQARTSRLYLQTQTPTGQGELKTKIEFDFFTYTGNEKYTNSIQPRLRHAYGQLGGWLAGQTWSTFMDLDSIADTLEFIGPTGMSFIRQPQIRYTLPLGSGALSLAIENPESNFRNQNQQPATALDRGPDLVAAWNMAADWGHLHAAGLYRDLRVEDGSGNTSSKNGWGLSLAGSFRLGRGDLLFYQVNGGAGIGRYIQGAGVSGAYDQNTRQLATQRAVGGVLGLQHDWSGKVRSTLVYSPIAIDNPSGFGDIAKLNRRVDTWHANLIWKPIPAADVGIEYVRAHRRTEDGSTGQADRLQASLKYSF